MMEDVTEDIGAILKAQRKKLGYSLEEVAQRTRIRKAYLESIENNQFSDLPGKVYVTGFIRGYCRCLGLDSDVLIAQMEDGETDEACLSLEPGAVTRIKSRTSAKPAAAGARRSFLVGFLVVLVLGCAIFFVVSKFQGTRSGDQTSVRVEKDTTPEQKPAEGTVAAPDTPQKVPSAEESVLPPPAAKGKVSVGKLLPPVPPAGASLRMLAVADGSLTIYVDDRKPQQYDLRDGLDLTWRVKNKVKVESGPGVARFWLSGEELDVGSMDSFRLQPAVGE